MENSTCRHCTEAICLNVFVWIAPSGAGCTSVDHNHEPADG